MVFEPISVLGIVGTTLGMLSFVASTAENINSRITNFEDCPRKLRGYHDSLIQSDRELKHWHSLWSENASHPGQDPRFYDKATYIFFWGQEGLEEIWRRLVDICEQFKAVVAVLQCQSLKLPKQDVANWNKWLSQPRATNRSPIDGEHVSWVGKLLFAIYKDATIKRRMDDLDKRVTELNRASVSLFRLAHGTRFKAPEPQRLKEIRTLQRERNLLLMFLNGLYHEDDRSLRPDWFLVLNTPPLPHVLSRLKRESCIRLSFQFCTATAEIPQLSKIDYCMDLVAHQNQTLRAEALSPSQYPFVKHDVLELHQLKPLELFKMTTYTLAAQSAASSAVLLYDSTWLYGFCFCGIALCETTAKEVKVSFAPGDCNHVALVDRESTFFLLAVFLAELALGAPLRVLRVAPNHSPEFEIPDPRLPLGYSNPVSWNTVMDILGVRRDDIEDYTSIGYHEAMQYAFELGTTLMTRGYMSDDIEECIEKIVIPLQKHHELLSARLADLQKRKWFNDRRGKLSKSSS